MTTCVICRRQPYDRAHACATCRKWLARDLGEIAGLAALLPLVVAPAGGSEGGVPLRLAAVDLGLPLWGGASSATVHDPYGDQGGQVPVAARLDSWVQDWAITRDRGEGLPGVTVPEIVGWLLNRIEDACDEHPAVDEFAAEVRAIKAAICRTLSTEPMRAVRYGASCPRCEAQTLRRTIGADWIECEGCGRLWSDVDYAELVRETIPAGRLLTTTEAGVYGGVGSERIRWLAHKGKLCRDIGPWGDRPRYDPAEVRRALGLDRELVAVR